MSGTSATILPPKGKVGGRSGCQEVMCTCVQREGADGDKFL